MYYFASEARERLICEQLDYYYCAKSDRSRARPSRLIAKQRCKCNICSAPDLNSLCFYAGARRTIKYYSGLHATRSNSFGYSAVRPITLFTLSAKSRHFTRHVECPPWIIKIIHVILSRSRERNPAHVFIHVRLTVIVRNVITKDRHLPSRQIIDMFELKNGGNGTKLSPIPILFAN